MTFSWKRVNAIFQKDFKEFTRNMAVSMVIYLPVLMAAIFSRMGMDPLVNSNFTIGFAFTMVGSYVQCCLIAEEKEKNTLRGLMLSPANTYEILGGKSALSFVLTMVVAVASVMLAGYTPANIPVLGLGLALCAIFFIGLGTLLGLIAKSVMESSVIVLPVIFLFSTGSGILSFSEKYPIFSVIEYIPNLQLLEMATKVDAGAGFGEIWSHLGIIALWSVVIYIITVVVYKKQMVD
ncbi:ABC transporter permease subunit [Bacillus sp. N3536]|nr:ABC transporter permease subunit [Bacillus sp. N3536]